LWRGAHEFPLETSIRDATFPSPSALEIQELAEILLVVVWVRSFFLSSHHKGKNE
jgi:hypothetical protein